MNNLIYDEPIKKKSIVILISKNIPCLFTLKKIISKDCIIKGVVICEKKGFFYRIKKEINDIKKYGLFKRLSQILLSIYFILFKSKSEKIFLNNCFEHISLKNILAILSEKKIEVKFTKNYQSNNTLDFIKIKKPDFLVSHTPYWIGRKVREISKEKLVIGSHPGIVPYYRGAHSAFWSRLNGDKNKNGYSIFCLDKGVDSGPIIKQEVIPYDETISFHSDIGVSQALEVVLEWMISYPSDYSLVIKGHPVNYSAMEPLKKVYLDFLKGLEDNSQLNRFIWLDKVSIHQVLASSDAVITVNSGVGIEAILHQKKVLTFGNADYSTIAHKIMYGGSLDTAVQNLNKTISIAEDIDSLTYKQQCEDFISAWYESYYDIENMSTFEKLLNK